MGAVMGCHEDGTSVPSGAQLSTAMLGGSTTEYLDQVMSFALVVPLQMCGSWPTEAPAWEWHGDGSRRRVALGARSSVFQRCTCGDPSSGKRVGEVGTIGSIATVDDGITHIVGAGGVGLPCMWRSVATGGIEDELPHGCTCRHGLACPLTWSVHLARPLKWSVLCALYDTVHGMCASQVPENGAGHAAHAGVIRVNIRHRMHA